jgi:hypothetical protein
MIIIHRYNSLIYLTIFLMVWQQCKITLQIMGGSNGNTSNAIIYVDCAIIIMKGIYQQERNNYISVLECYASKSTTLTSIMMCIINYQR